MTTTQTNPRAATPNGSTDKPKQTRTRKALTGRDVAGKIADLLAKVPSEKREAIVALAQNMLNAAV